MDIDLRTLTPSEREKLRKDLDAIELEEKEAYKKEFVQGVVDLAIEKGVKWSEAVALVSNYTPENDAKAKKLGFGFKGKGKGGRTVYYTRNRKGTSEI